jgi:hypothetical protein
VPNHISIFHFVSRNKVSVQVKGFVKGSKMVRFYGEMFVTPRPTHKLYENPLFAVRYCLFNTRIFGVTLHTGGLPQFPESSVVQFAIQKYKD